jgi:hypothetical protein
MNRALLAKELRALKPYAACILALFVVTQIYLLATESPDQQRYNPENWLEKSRSGSLVVVAFFSLLTGASVLMPEREQGTLLFLDSLPVSRTRIFLMKALAALLVVVLVPFVDIGSDVIFDFFSRTSVDGSFPWNFAVVDFGLQILACGFLLSMAMLVSFTRAWFALVSGLLFWTYLWLRGEGFRWVAWLDSYELIGPAWDGSRVLISWPHVLWQFVAMVVVLLIAWLGFLSLGDRAQYMADRLGRLRWLGALAVAVRWLAPIVWIAALVRLSGTSAGDGAQRVVHRRGGLREA